MNTFTSIMTTMDILQAKHDAATARGNTPLADAIFTELLEYALLGCNAAKERTE